VRASTWRRFPGEYTFRAYLGTEVTKNDASQYVNERSARLDWWSALDTVGSRDVLDARAHPEITADRFMVEGELGSQPKQIDAKFGIKEWL
jgi:hypothetical protein